MKLFSLIGFILILTACCQVENKASHPPLVIKDGVLKIYADSLNDKIKSIQLINSKNTHQTIVLDSKLSVLQIQNVLEKSPRGKNYVNTWVALDKYGNVDVRLSYNYNTFISQEDSVIYINCALRQRILSGSCFLLSGDFSSDFNSFKSSIDTILFDENLVAKIPLNKWKYGKNNIRFVIVEEELVGDTLKNKRTYVSKDFFLKK